MPATLKVRGQREASLLLHGVADRLEHLQPGLRTLLRPLTDLQEGWWATDGRGTWPPLDPDTVAQDRRRGEDTRQARDTGRLHRAATDPASPDASTRATNTDLTWAIDLPYAGYVAGFGREPMLDPTAGDAERLADELAGWILP